MSLSRLVAAVVALVFVCAGVGAGLAAPATAQTTDVVVGRPGLSVYAPDAVVEPGTETTVDLFVANDGQITRGGPTRYENRVTAARAASLVVRDGGTPIDVRTGRFPLGVVPPGTSGPVPLSLVVSEGTPPGSYRLPVEVTYSYTSAVEYRPGDAEGRDVRYTDRTTTRTLTLVVQVEDRAQFRVVNAATGLAPGESGTVSLALENVGTATAREASAVVGSADPDLRVGSPRRERTLPNETTATSARAGLGTWTPGERRQVTLPARLASEATVRNYPLTVLVAYTDADGVVRRSRDYVAVVRPAPPVRLSLRNVTDDLRVGDEGTVRGQVVAGEVPVRSAVLVLRRPGGDREYALGDLAPGERAPFSFSLTVPNGDDAGPRELAFAVRYVGPDGRTVVTDPLRATVRVGERRDRFRIEARDPTFAVDSDGRLAVRVTNVGPETASDVQLALNTTDPLSSDAPTAFVPELAPGESATTGFALTVSADAVASTYPARVSVRYETPTGDVRNTPPSPVGVRVVEEEPTEPLLVAVVVVVALAVMGLWWRVRR